MLVNKLADACLGAAVAVRVSTSLVRLQRRSLRRSLWRRSG